MTVLVFKLLGGVGLFLMGMVLLADGIKSFAGDALRTALVRFTGRPFKAFTSGALITAIVQSSSATTVAVIGFVSAGLLTFPQAVGVVLGASLGTTSTGWIVSVLGLKVSIGFYALPLVGVGAFMKLLALGRWKSFGLALAGFGLIFVGIETLQDGMQGLSGVFNLAELPSTGVFRHILMVVIGTAMTVVMQSSSAAIATTLTALHTASINFEQAAYLVIGAAIGTTVTGVLASIGAGVSTRRTALAHVMFNVITGIIALVMLPVFLRVIGWAQIHMELEPGATSLAAFHTSFIAVGVVLFLPFVNQFSRWIERLLPEEGPELTRHLDALVLNVPAVALEATRRALSETACEIFSVIRDRLGDVRKGLSGFNSTELEQALDQTQQFLARIPPVSENQPLSHSRLTQMHAIDHLMRLRPYLYPPSVLGKTVAYEHLTKEIALCREILEVSENGLRGRVPPEWLEILERKSQELSEMHQQGRTAVLRQTAGGNGEPALALNILDAMRWLNRAGYHAWRICNYLGARNNEDTPVAEEKTQMEDLMRNEE
jgi:phosphate:Na+ symporter